MKDINKTPFADDPKEQHEFSQRYHMIPVARMRLLPLFLNFIHFIRHAIWGYCTDGCVWAVFAVEMFAMLSWVNVGYAALALYERKWLTLANALTIALLCRIVATANGKFLSLDRILNRIYTTMGPEFIRAVMENKAVLVSSPGGIEVEGNSMDDLKVNINKQMKKLIRDAHRAAAEEAENQRMPGESEIDFLIRQANAEFKKKQQNDGGTGGPVS